MTTTKAWLVASIAALTGLIGCAQTPPEACPVGADASQLIFIRQITFARETAGTSEGFNLDDRVSTAGDREGCRKRDFTSPEGVAGVDNAISQLLPIVESQTGGLRLDDVLQTAIDNGQLLLAIEVAHLDDPMNDPCVEVRVRPVAGAPLLGTDGRVIPGQTFDVVRDGELSTLTNAALVNGVIDAGPGPIALPVQVLDARFTLHITGGRIRLQRGEDGSWTGVLGGGISVTEMQQIAGSLTIPDALMSAVTTLLNLNADLEPNEAGMCGRLSATLLVGGVDAFLYEGSVP